MRIFNNTEIEDTNHIIALYRHLITTRIKSDLIESITFNKESFDVFGHDDSFVKTYKYSSFSVKGKIRWYDKTGGIGEIRLNNTKVSVKFYACNVIGANSPYHFLVDNLELKEGDEVVARVSSDYYTFNELGLTKVRKVA